MRFQKIKMQNYRQYKDVEISFEKKFNDINIFVAENGDGKSNLLNAINWCLYEEEPNLRSQDKKKGYPIINMKSLRNGDNLEAMVELTLFDPNNTLTISRKQKFYKDESYDKSIQSAILYSSGKKEELKDIEIKDAIDNFVPHNLREYFFFDVENLQKYFDKRSSKNNSISQAVNQFSHINKLSLMKSHLNEVQKNIQSKISKDNDVDHLFKEKENLSEEKKLLKNNIKSLNREKEKFDKIKQESFYDIKNAEKYDEEEKKYLECINSIKKYKKDLQLYKKEKNTFIFQKSMMLFLWDAIESSREIIGNSFNKHHSSIPIELLNSTIEKNCCEICSRKLDEDSKNLIKDHIINMESINMDKFSVFQEFNNNIPSLSSLKEFKNTCTIYNNNIQLFENHIKRNEEEAGKIEYFLERQDKAYLKDLMNKQDKASYHYDDAVEKIAKFEVKLAEISKRFNEASSEIDSSVKKKNINESLRKKFEFIKKSLDVINRVEKLLLDETRENIQSKTRENLISLMSKEKTYVDVQINKDYEMSIFDQEGREVSGTSSSGEGVLSVMSFISALHDISGLESPIIIDNPYIKVSSKNRHNFSEILLKLSEEQQIILFFIDTEYSPDVANSIEDKLSNKYNIELLNEEESLVVRDNV